MATTVWLVQQDGLVRDALQRVLAEVGFDVVASLSVGNAARSPFGGSTPHVVVADAVDPGACPELRAAIAQMPAAWLVRVDPGDPATLAEVLAAGARGLYSARTNESAVIDAVRHLAAGRSWLAPDLVPTLVRDYMLYYRRRRTARRRLEALGAKDIQMLALVADGLSNAEIAAELHLAVSTVKDYVATLLGRIGVSRPEAIALAIRADIAAARSRQRGDDAAR